MSDAGTPLLCPECSRPRGGTCRCNWNTQEGTAMTDPTEAVRRKMVEAGQPAADLAAAPGQKWTAQTLGEDFTVVGFAAPFVVVIRKSDNVTGTLEFFTHSPRVYFSFREHQE